MSILYKIKSEIISWFADIRFYKGGLILFGESHYQVKGEDVRLILDALKPGDVLLRKYDHYLGSQLISGYWSHAAIYVGDDQVIHMLGEGINKEDILTFTRCDDICILRPKDEIIKTKAIENALAALDTKVEYDYDFDSVTSKRFYCTEFVDYIFNYPVRNRIGCDRAILPDHFLECSIFEKVLEVYGPKK